MQKIVRRKNKTQSIKHTWPLYFMFLFPFLWFIIFSYIPMAGLTMSFLEYEPGTGIIGFFTGNFVGIKYFKQFVESYYFWRIIRNTLAISFLDIAINFFVPILFALILNEIRNKHFRVASQTISYLPKFISIVVIASLYKEFLGLNDGIINNLIEALGGKRVYFLAEPKYFWILFTLMNTWATLGWSSIIFTSAISGIDPQLYEACEIDGGGRFTMMFKITIPSIMSTIMVMFILRIGNVLTVGLEPILLLSNKSLLETAEVLSLHVYNRGLNESSNFSYATAVGLFQSVIGFIMVVITNAVSKKLSNISLW